MFKFLYNNFWYPFFGKILSKFVFLIEGKKNNNERSNDMSQKMKH